MPSARELSLLAALYHYSEVRLAEREWSVIPASELRAEVNPLYITCYICYIAVHLRLYENYTVSRGLPSSLAFGVMILVITFWVFD